MRSEAAVVIPLWKDTLNLYEEISLRQCLSILKEHDVIFVTHTNLEMESFIALCDEYRVDFQCANFDQKYFENVHGYNQLLKSIKFYRSFIKFKYILIYQLDCFVFKDDLNYWCGENYSYIGAPWLEGYTKALSTAPVIGVGNGGFSLRKVRDHLRVLHSFSLLDSPSEVLNRCLKKTNNSGLSKIWCSMYELLFCNNTFFLFNRSGLHEDVFWSLYGNRFSWYSIPDSHVASNFSIEVQPHRFLTDDSSVPFGCHAWWKYDPDFWRPHIERFGYKI